MPFRRRLTFAVVLILIVPVGAIALLLFRLTNETREGKADARLAGALNPVLTSYRAELDDARREAARLGRSPEIAAILAGTGSSTAGATVSRLARSAGLTRLEVRGAGGEPLASFQRGDPIADALVRVRAPGGRGGTVLVSGEEASRFVSEAARVTDLEAAIGRPGSLIAASSELEGAGPALGARAPRSEDISLPSGDYRLRMIELPGAGGPRLRLALLGPRGATAVSSGQALAGTVLAGFVLIAVLLIVPLLRDLRRLHDRAASEAVTDDLTGLANRRRFDQIIAKEVERARRFDRPISLILLDLDDFKQVNDTYGHLEGDRVLRAVAELLGAESRSIDEPSRYGGEEFAMVLPETDVGGAMDAAERVRGRVESAKIRTSTGERIVVTVSAGVAGTPDNLKEVAELVRAADGALYQAKREGKNRVERSGASDLAEPART